MTQKNVLVTGASTGIGRKIAEHLAANSYYIFAGARKEDDIAELSKIENVTGVRLDVTKTDEIETCVKLIERSGGLFALINNAGIGNMGPLLEMNEKKLFFQLDVNLVAANRLLQHFFEQLKENEGRIINIASINGFLPTAFGGGYSISKFGMVAYSEQLRLELNKFGIDVSCVEPGFFHSAIFKKSEKDLSEIRETTTYYKEEYQAERNTKLRDDNIKDPIMVAERVLEILSVEKPHVHYTVGNKNEEQWAFQALFNRIVEVNKGLENPWSFEDLQHRFSKVNEGEFIW